MPFEAMSCGTFDIGVIGEGEEILLEIARSLRGRSKATDEAISGVKGIIFREGGNLVITPKREAVKNLDSLGFRPGIYYPRCSTTGPPRLLIAACL